MNEAERLSNAPVLLYDGVCGVCNSAVRTILRFDRRGTLRFAEYLGGWWQLALAARAVPAPIRDALYMRFAALRYRVAGRHDTCPVPSPDVRGRFLDGAYG